MNSYFNSLIVILYAAIVGGTFSNLVLCFDQVGHVAVEVGGCDCTHDASGPAADSDHPDCGPCSDISPAADTPRLVVPVILAQALPVVPAFNPPPRAPRDARVDASPRIASSLHPSIRTAVLLI